jgi:hypothetical protein
MAKRHLDGIRPRDRVRSIRVNDQTALYLACVAAGALPVIGAIVRGGAVGAGTTICIFLTLAGVFGLVSDSWRARRGALPVARVSRRPARPQTR